MKTIKLFVGLHLPDTLKEVLTGYQKNLKRSLVEGVPDGESVRPERIIRTVSPEKLHMTLLFLGDIPEELLPVVYAAFDRAISDAPPAVEGVLRLIPTLIGAFPNTRRPRVIWAGVDDPSGSTKLLARKLREELTAQGNRSGFSVDARPFVPHITIAYPRRNLSAKERKALTFALDNRKFFQKADPQAQVPTEQSHRVPRIAVIESRPSPGGTVYIDRHWKEL